MSDSLAVLMVDSERTWRGGENQAWLLMRGLVARGHRVGLAAPRESAILDRARELDVEHIALPPGASALAPRAVWALRRAIARGGWDVVHAHASHAHAWTSLACLGLRRAPLRVVSRRVDFPISTRGPGAWKYRSGADLYLAISSAVERELRAGGVARERIRRVPSGIDPERVARRGDGRRQREELGAADAAVVGTIAALAPHKALHHLVDAAERLRRSRRVRVAIVGEGPTRRSLERRIRERGLEDVVTLVGFRADALDWLGAFDVFVMPSELEGLCTSILDAQLAGVPVVASATGGIVDIVEDGRSGLLVPPGDAEALARAIERVLDDAELAARLVAGGRESAARYHFDAMVYKTEAAYREALARRA